MYGEANTVDAHAALAGKVLGVELINGTHYLGNGLASELVTKHINGNFLAWVVKGSHSRRYALYR